MARPSKPAHDLQRRALDEPRLTLADLSDAAGVSRGSLARYRLDTENRVRMPKRVAKRLARFLRKHAQELQGIADDLEGLED